MLSFIVALLLVPGASALALGRRGFVAQTAVAVATTVVAAPAFAASCGDELVGTYTDPNHPGCTRRVAAISGTKFASVYGADEDGKPWVAKAAVACPGYNGVDAPQLIVDFTPKGGPADVAAVFSSTGGLTNGKLTFPDGNVWSMVPCTNPKLTKQQLAACQA
ncbi:hypothetical protein M885DRAFT_506832, partial [Pelagophyceae sp. CCMP2097]